MHSVEISRFEGEKPIEELEVYPREYAKNCDKKRQKKEERGRQYLRLVEKYFSICDYDGELSYGDPLAIQKRNLKKVCPSVISTVLSTRSID